ncbi:MAG: hypothetical protein Q4F31_03875 [Eubacteriales bacterium]|nr:hypothetical protein [Eubacteriales bacterium]
MSDKILGILGLMRKAGAIALGEDDASAAVLAGKARLLVLPSDAGDKKRERALRYLDGRSCELIQLPYSGKELSEAVGIGNCSMAAVTDIGFADSLMKQLAITDPDRYGQSADTIHEKLSRISRRKTEKPGVKARKK